MSLYTDLFLRDNFEDTGEEPNIAASVSSSPDIIPYGQGTLTAQQLIDDYGPPLIDVPIQSNQFNNIYVRTKNNYNGTTTGKVYLYYAPPNPLVNVSTWQTNSVPNNNGTLYANVSATTLSQVAPGDQPFSFTPTSSLGTHFCYLAYVTTSLNNNSLPSSNFASWDDFVDWVKDNAWVAWHNVNVVSTLPAQGYLSELVFQNISNADEFYGFTCSYSGMPVNSVLTIYALADETAGFSGFSGSVTTSTSSGSLGQGATFPANYQTTIFISCQFPGNPTQPPAGLQISTASLGTTSGSTTEIYKKYLRMSLTAEQVGIDLAYHGLAADSRFVKIMSYNALFNPGG